MLTAAEMRRLEADNMQRALRRTGGKVSGAGGAAEWGVHGITVNAICPGVFPSKMAAAMIEKSGAMLIDATPSAILEVLHDWPHFPDFMPRVAAVTVDEHSGNTWLVTIDVHFSGHLPAEETAATIRRMEKEIRERFPKIKRIYIEASDSDSIQRRRARANKH